MFSVPAIYVLSPLHLRLPNSNIFAYTKNHKPAVTCRRFVVIRPADWQGAGLCLRPSAQAVGQILGFALAAGVCAVEERDAQSPRSNPKNSHLSAQGARPSAWMPAVFGRVQKADSRESSSPPALPLSKLISKESIFQVGCAILGAAYTCVYIKPHSAKLFVSDPAIMK